MAAKRKYNPKYGYLDWFIDNNNKRIKEAEKRIAALDATYQKRAQKWQDVIESCSCSNADYQGTKGVIDWEEQNLPSILIIY